MTILLNEEQFTRFQLSASHNIYFFHSFVLSYQTLRLSVVTSFGETKPWDDESIQALYDNMKQFYIHADRNQVPLFLTDCHMQQHPIDTIEDEGLSEFLQSWNGTDFTAGIEPLKKYIAMEREIIIEDMQSILEE